MRPPADLTRPFFAYGIFRPGQIAFFQVRDFAREVTDPAYIKGSLLLRDGVPIVDPRGEERVAGALITFRPDRAADAYGRISALEPKEQYRWSGIEVDGVAANVLLGKSPDKGTLPWEERDEWDGWTDPMFTTALDVVEETIEASTFDWDLKPMFRLQMAYLLLWSCIERYVSLRYHLGREAVAGKVKQLAMEPAFAVSLRSVVPKQRTIYRADRPTEKVTLDPGIPEKALSYYYQVRSNVTHRGKAAPRDHDTLGQSLAELLDIFREVMKAARDEAGGSS